MVSNTIEFIKKRKLKVGWTWNWKQK